MSTGAPAQVLLRDPAGPLEATFVPSAGMLCSSLRSSSRELLAENAGVRAYAQRGKTMGIPLLYPWANRLAGFGYRPREDGVFPATPRFWRSTETACRSTG